MEILNKTDFLDIPKLEIYDFIFFAYFMDYKLKYFKNISDKSFDKSTNILPR